jgi:hypothetical protein
MSRYRLMLKQADVTPQENGQLAVRISLVAQDKHLEGQVTSDAAVIPENYETSVMRLAVDATLKALLPALKRSIKFEVCDVALKTMDSDQQRFVVVLLKTDYFVEPVGEAIQLLGACQINKVSTVAEAAARAVLNATNRTVSQLLR